MEEDTDSDATTCDSDWYNEGVHIIPDSMGYGGDSNSTGVGGANHTHSQPSSEIVTSPVDNHIHTRTSSQAVQSGASPQMHESNTLSPCNLDSTKYYSGGESPLKGKTPNWRLRGAYAFAAALLDSSDEENEGDVSVLPAKDGGSSIKQTPTCSSETDSSCTSSKGELSANVSPPLQLDSAFDDHLFDRPRFAHSPINRRRPLTLCLPSSATTKSIEIPATINQYLRDYQQEGVRFLYEHFTRETGAVLCDDMGLGKTVQVIAFMCSVLHKACTKADIILTGPRRAPCEGCFLVVCPGSVIYNWTAEIETWSHLKYGVYHRDKKEVILDKAKRRKLEVVLTTHETARIHVDDLNTVNWLAVFCDEVQVIKGTCSQVTAAMNSLEVTRRYGLTGTALQNNLSELWCIMNWANPMCLGSLSEFQSRYEKPILEGQKYNCTKRQLALSRQKLEELEEVMKKYVLRRTKSLIASQLPSKEEFVVFCPITDLQEQIYQSILETDDVQLILHSSEPCDCYSGKKRRECCYAVNAEGTAWQKLCNPYTVLLNKCANHLGLLLPGNSASRDQQDKASRVCEEVFRKHPKFTKMSRKASFMTLSSTEYCGKMQTLERLLETFHKDKDKVIIFSMSVKLLNIVEDFVVVKNYVYSRLDGGTKIEERAKLVQNFNSDSSQFIFLISKKCGGVGLNITGANRVIIFDPSWNPATDQQAEDRAFRIGQSRDVKVFRLITEGTVEEMMYLRQVYKQQLANMTMEGNRERRYFTAVAGDKNQKGELFGYRNLFPLRKSGQPGLNLTLDILKRVDSVESGVKMAKDQVSGMRVDETTTAVAKQVRDTEQSLLPGMVTIAHSGGRSVVGNSKVEEHLGKEAQSAVFGLQQHSQEPANYASNKLEGVSDESDDIDFQPPTPKRKVCKTSSSRSSGRSTIDSATPCASSETEDTKESKQTRFEQMATSFGFSSPLEFAEHVIRISKEERKALLEEFSGARSKVQSEGKRRPKENERTLVKEKDEVDRSMDLGMSSSSHRVGNSKRRQRTLPGTASRTARSAFKHTPPKRRPKRLEYLEEDSPHASPPGLLRSESNRTEKEYLVSDELGLAIDTGLAVDHQQREECSKLLSSSTDSTSLVSRSQHVHGETGGNKPLECTSSHSQVAVERDPTQSLYIDGNSLIDKLFQDSQAVASLPCTVTKSAEPLSSETCSPSVRIVGKVQLQSDTKSTLDTDLNIDELLFGF